jgi:NADH:ubiquinone oxidoreductase subunit 6 (subunit J)
MKTKLKRFAIISAIMISSLFLAFMLLNVHKEVGSGGWRDNLIMAIVVGLLLSATLVFFKKSNKQQE